MDHLTDHTTKRKVVITLPSIKKLVLFIGFVIIFLCMCTSGSILHAVNNILNPRDTPEKMMLDAENKRVRNVVKPLAKKHEAGYVQGEEFALVRKDSQTQYALIEGRGVNSSPAANTTDSSSNQKVYSNNPIAKGSEFPPGPEPKIELLDPDTNQWKEMDSGAIALLPTYVGTWRVRYPANLILRTGIKPKDGQTIQFISRQGVIKLNSLNQWVAQPEGIPSDQILGPKDTFILKDSRPGAMVIQFSPDARYYDAGGLGGECFLVSGEDANITFTINTHIHETMYASGTFEAIFKIY